MLYALIGAVLIGLSLGLMGSGGSILTVPVLTFLVGQEDKVAIAGSLAIVGAISLVAGVPYARRGDVDFRSVLLFGVPGMAGAYFGAYLSQFVSGAVQLLVFAALMLVAGGLMIRPAPSPNTTTPGVGAAPRSPLKIGLEGLVVGVITGFVGVGGGFMIVPALVLLGGLTMRQAVGTSLFIIALKSFAGFAKYTDVLDRLGLALDWEVIGVVSAVGILGSFAGSALSARVPQTTLRRAFALFLFVVAAFVVLRSGPEAFGRAASVSPKPIAVVEPA